MNSLLNLTLRNTWSRIALPNMTPKHSKLLSWFSLTIKRLLGFKCNLLSPCVVTKNAYFGLNISDVKSTMNSL